MRWLQFPNIFGPSFDPDPEPVEDEPDTEPDEPEEPEHLTAGGIIIRLLVLLFLACLFFGAAATFGWLHHAWLFVDGVFHSKSPTIHLPHISLPTTPVSS